jgi:protein-tyrosine phosphatase
MKIGRNERCPCGSGKKYKNCCMRKSSLGYKLNLKGKNAENFVYELSQKSFITDWCYRSPKLPNGKEICDLLISYDNIAVIWQIKDLELDENNKYKKSEVEKNLHQLSTARHRLFDKKLEIELENPRRGKEKFNPNTITEIYQISALLGKGEDYFSGIEIIDGKFAHTFTREFTEIVLEELDTISDFIEYLREKEKLFSKNVKVIIMGDEKELLAYYLMNQRTFEKIGEADEAIFQDGIWDDLQKRPEYLTKKKEDRISYGWDDIINRVHTGGGEYETVAREMARLNRFDRRVMSKAFYEAHVRAHRERSKNVFRRLLEIKGTTYCFLFFDDPEPRTNRKKMLEIMCFIARGIFDENFKVVGIATEMKMRPTCSYDFCYLELPKWTREHQENMEKLQKETGIFSNYTVKQIHEDEYPAP